MIISICATVVIISTVPKREVSVTIQWSNVYCVLYLQDPAPAVQERDHLKSSFADNLNSFHIVDLAVGSVRDSRFLARLAERRHASAPRALHHPRRAHPLAAPIRGCRCVELSHILIQTDIQ